MRNGVDAISDIGGALAQFLQLLQKLLARSGRIALQTSYLHAQEGQSLVDIVVQIARDPAPLLLLRIDQPAAQIAEHLFGEPVLGDIDTRADIACEGTVRIKSGDTDIDDPTINTILPPEPVLHFKAFAPVKRVCVDLVARSHVLGMDGLNPSSSQLRLDG